MISPGDHEEANRFARAGKLKFARPGGYAGFSRLGGTFGSGRLLRIFEPGHALFQIRADRFELVGSADQRALESRLELEAVSERELIRLAEQLLCGANRSGDRRVISRASSKASSLGASLTRVCALNRTEQG